jgi:hypothetical protein
VVVVEELNVVDVPGSIWYSKYWWWWRCLGDTKWIWWNGGSGIVIIRYKFQ